MSKEENRIFLAEVKRKGRKGMIKAFDKNNADLINQFENINWIKESGICQEELQGRCNELMKENYPKAIIKAKTFALILEKSRIAIDKDDIFQDKIAEGVKWGGIIAKQRGLWEREICETLLPEENERMWEAYNTGTFSAHSDFGHTSPNTRLLMEVGFKGILDRIDKYAIQENLTQKQKDFYESCRIVYEAIINFIKRLASACEKTKPENSKALYNIAEGKPGNIYEAMQLIIIYFLLHEYVGGTRVRTLGRLDVMLSPFYNKDIEKGTFTKSEIKEMIKYFFNKLHSAKVPYNLPLCLGGADAEGNDVTDELTYLLVETYNELEIYDPKIHIRVSDKTPDSFVKLVLDCIRGGNSSFVFLNDNIVIKSLSGVGIKEEDAKDYVPIGCYEPAVWGKEIGCTGNGGVSLAKAVEFTITDGYDLKSGKKISVSTGKINTYEDFINALKEHIRFMTESGTNFICSLEKHYGEIGPDPILSGMYDHSIQTGTDVFEGGAQYNNTSYYFYFIATLVDSVCAVKRLVFDEKRVSFSKLCEILKNNWQGSEKLRLFVKNIPEKYGNNNPAADEVTKEFSDYCASLVTNKPNGRGGVFKAAMFSIDHFVKYGEKTMATPDGRMDGEVLSKNLCSSVGMDKNGITALINSVSKIDHTKFPNGTVLDVVLHPSAVSGEEGLDAFYMILRTYFKKGGMALHGNVFNAQTLRKAQQNPEKYSNLQVRVCGWNAYFVKLSKAEQDCFIKQAESNC